MSKSKWVTKFIDSTGNVIMKYNYNFPVTGAVGELLVGDRKYKYIKKITNYEKRVTEVYVE